MPRVPKHRKPIIDAAVALFRRQGYSGVGLNDIIDASGAPKGSLYHYFPAGKASIAAAAVEEAGKRVAATLEKLSDSEASGAAVVIAHARLLAGWLRKSGYRDGCPITTVLLELAPADRAVSDAGRKAYAVRLSVLREKFVADGFSQPRADCLAILCTSALQGALIQARVERSDRALKTAAAELALMIEAERAGA